MRFFAFIAFWLLPIGAFAQSRSDYETTMQHFREHFNRGDAKEIRAMFSGSWGKRKKQLWPQHQLDEVRSDYGKMLSCTYVTIDTVSDENRLALFKVVYEKETFMTAFNLDRAKKFRTFRLNTSSPFIDGLLKKP